MRGEVWSDGSIDSTLTVKIISPRQGETFTVKKPVVVAEIINTGDTVVSQVDFYINVNKVGQINKAPWSFHLDDLPEGVFDIVVRAFSGTKATGTSAPVQIIIRADKK
jgi:hypothetical protein